MQIIVDILGTSPKQFPITAETSLLDELNRLINEISDDSQPFIVFKTMSGVPCIVRKTSILSLTPAEMIIVCPQCGSEDFPEVHGEDDSIVRICGKCGFQRIEK
jgi:hypothetical protein